MYYVFEFILGGHEYTYSGYYICLLRDRELGKRGGVPFFMIATVAPLESLTLCVGSVSDLGHIPETLVTLLGTYSELNTLSIVSENTAPEPRCSITRLTKLLYEIIVKHEHHVFDTRLSHFKVESASLEVPEFLSNMDELLVELEQRHGIRIEKLSLIGCTLVVPSTTKDCDMDVKQVAVL
ncbi:hypothetical protein K474DRAFT_1726424 [Panus rudis PR-1116 ss-1]|nr:hypothetical protein K474DRAFT_1726424 [Panus rudis PR-1116 ss-1]